MKKWLAGIGLVLTLALQSLGLLYAISHFPFPTIDFVYEEY